MQRGGVYQWSGLTALTAVPDPTRILHAAGGPQNLAVDLVTVHFFKTLSRSPLG